MNADYALQVLLNAMVVSALYGLLATAYVLVHGITRKVNLAFGAFSVWASYLFINTTLALTLSYPGQTVMPLAVAVLYAVAGTVALAVAVERFAVRPLLRGGTLAMLTMSLGLLIGLEEALRLINNNADVWLTPRFNTPFSLTAAGDVVTTPLQLFVGLSGAAICLLIITGEGRLEFGRRWRAVSQDMAMAELCGVDSGRVLAATFALASATAAMSGVLSALYYGQASFSGSLVIGLKTLFVAVVGGLDSVAGAFLAAMILGLFETFWSSYFSEEWRDVISLLGLTALMIMFPAGLFAGTGRRTVAN